MSEEAHFLNGLSPSNGTHCHASNHTHTCVCVCVSASNPPGRFPPPAVTSTDGDTNGHVLPTNNAAQYLGGQLGLLALVPRDVGAPALQRVRGQGLPVEQHHQQRRRVLPEVGDLRDALVKIPGHPQALREVEEVTVLLGTRRNSLPPTDPMVFSLWVTNLTDFISPSFIRTSL